MKSFNQLIVMGIILDYEQYIVLEFTSSEGNKFEVGYPKEAGYTKENLEAEFANAKAGTIAAASDWCPIYCPVGETGQISQCAKDIGIEAASVYPNSYPINQEYTYQLVFVNTKGWGFTFKDESGDNYYCSTILNRSHFINYNSSNPTMIEVTGS